MTRLTAAGFYSFFSSITVFLHDNMSLYVHRRPLFNSVTVFPSLVDKDDDVLRFSGCRRISK